MKNTSVTIEQVAITSKPRYLRGTWTVDLDVNSMYAFEMKQPKAMKVSRGKYHTHIDIWSKEAKEFVYNATGQRYTRLNLTDDDPLLSMLLMKFGDNV